MMSPLENPHRCNGCGACAQKCPHGAIVMRPDAEGFFRNLKNIYPYARIVALLPLWRNDNDHITDFGPLTDLNPALRKRIEAIGGITVIDCYDAIPHEQRYFTDLVHPKTEGHQYYFDFIRKYI